MIMLSGYQNLCLLKKFKKNGFLDTCLSADRNPVEQGKPLKRLGS